MALLSDELARARAFATSLEAALRAQVTSGYELEAALEGEGVFRHALQNNPSPPILHTHSGSRPPTHPPTHTERARATSIMTETEELRSAAVQMHLMLYTAPPAPPPGRALGPPSPPPHCADFTAYEAAREARALAAEARASAAEAALRDTAALLTEALAHTAAERSRVMEKEARLHMEYAAEVAALKAKALR